MAYSSVLGAPPAGAAEVSINWAHVASYIFASVWSFYWGHKIGSGRERVKFARQRLRELGDDQKAPTPEWERDE